MPFNKRIESFRVAFKGLYVFFAEEVHAKVHLVATIFAVFSGIYLKISTLEWVAILLCIALVVAIEAINSAIENVLDLLHPEHHPLAGRAKDVASGAVLWASVVAAIVGVLVFLPKILW